MWKKTLHIAIMVLVYVSSTSLMINKHYCSDQLMGTSFMTEAESCHNSEPTEKSCPKHPQNNTSKKDCCSSEFQLIKTELNYDLYQPQLKTFDFKEFIPVLTFLLQEHKIIISDHKTTFSKDDWDPPSPSSVNLSLFQRFLC